MSLINAVSLAGVEATVPLIQLTQTFLGLFSLFLNYSEMYPPDTNLYDACFDFIIVGGGTAGCVLANRLTEVKSWSVLLIEAGDNPDVMSNTPAVPFLVASSKADWNHYSVDDGYSAQAHKTKNIRMHNGKMLGGSSGINFMYYTRANEHDFESWVAEGNDGWDWDNVTFYYKKSERFNDPKILNSPSGILHNTDGYLGITQTHWPDNIKHYIDALKENDRDILLDTNGFQQIGYSSPPMTYEYGIRQSSAVAFITPIKDRPNLHVLRNTKGRRVILDENNKAIGVEIKLDDGTVTKAMANKEVILSTGSIVSPQLLMLSGIGPRDHLEEMDIEVRVESPHVGKNAEDHVFILLVLTGKLNPVSVVQNLQVVANPDTFPVPTLLGYAALDKEQTFPDYQVIAFPLPASGLLTNIFCSHMMELEDNICTALNEATLLKEHLFAAINLQHPYSTGEIKLKSNDPDDDPLIFTGHFSDERDLDTLAYCVEDYLTILNTTAMRSMNSEVVNMDVRQCAHLEFGTHDYWKCFILNTANSEWHIMGTCRMGREGFGVVNERLQVYGTESLRVVDSGVMPSMISGNPAAPTIMVAEKAADMIKQDHGIAISY